MNLLHPVALAFFFLGFESLNLHGQKDLPASSDEVADSAHVVAHFLCVWPEQDSLVEWTIVRELIPPDCEHFMDESTTDMGHEDCTDQIAFRNGNFMHFPATRPGVYLFFGVMPGTSDITYSGLVRLGDDILADWQGSITEFGIPMANMNWLESSALWYPFCD